jgi:hypothetical protein
MNAGFASEVKMDEEKFKLTPQVIILIGLAAACVIYFLLTIGARANPNYKEMPVPSEVNR